MLDLEHDDGLFPEEEEKRRVMEQAEDDFRRIATSDHGQRFLLRLFKYSGLWHRCFTGNSWTYYNEGKRDVGTWLFHQLKSLEGVSPEFIGKVMLIEESEDD